MRTHLFGTVVLTLLGLLVGTGCSTYDRWTTANQQTLKLFSQGRYPQAIRSARHALALADELYGPGHLSEAAAQADLALLLVLTGDWAQAEALLQQALLTKTFKLGPTHIETALVLTDLSEVERFQGKFAQAEGYGLQALTVLSANLPANHPLVAEAMTNLAFCYEAEHKLDQAERLYRRLLVWGEPPAETTGPQTQPFLNNLENAYRWQKRYTEVVLTSRLLGFGAPRQDHTQVLINLASLELARHRPQAALPLAEKALARDEQQLGPTHLRVALDLDLVGQAQLGLGRKAGVDALYQRAWDILQGKLETRHPVLVRVGEHYAQLLRSLGRPAAATALEKSMAAGSGQPLPQPTAIQR